jgi:hypothetical protein
MNFRIVKDHYGKILAKFIVHSNSSDPEGELSKNQRVLKFLVVTLPLETSETKQFLRMCPLVSKIIRMNYGKWRF